jgi:hypothetical protein
MNKNLIIAVVVTAIIAGGIGFAGGRQVAEKRKVTQDGNMITGDQSDRTGRFGSPSKSPNRGIRGGFVSGQIISRDATSMTVKLPDGNTRIVFLGANLEVTAYSSSTQAALVVGSHVRVSGETADAGALTARRVDISQ